MARVACIAMVKNESELAETFIRYHSAMFGAQNVYLFDNGSTDPVFLASLANAENQGVNVDRSHTTVEDFRQKGTLAAKLIERLDREADYDFYLLLDCDEFVVMGLADGYTCDAATIHRYLDSLRGERRILKVVTNLSNILGAPGAFQAASYSKVIFPRNVLKAITDRGYHGGTSVTGAGYVECEIAYVHYHYRPYPELVRFARQKLRAELTEQELDRPERLRDVKGSGHHMVSYLLRGAEDYYRQFRKNPSNRVHLPELLARFDELGTEAPFARFVLPPATVSSEAMVKPPIVVIDEATTGRVRGWALDRSTPTNPLYLQFLLDGSPVWAGACDMHRPDVRANGHPSEKVGFSFCPPSTPLGEHCPVLTAQDSSGQLVAMSVANQSCHEIALTFSPTKVTGAGSFSGGPEGQQPPLVLVDEATTSRIRGWALERHGPQDPVYLRFVVDGVLVWDGRCDKPRPDVRRSGHASELVGFDFQLSQRGPSAEAKNALTVERRNGERVPVIVGGKSQLEVQLTEVAARVASNRPILSQIDGFRRSRIHGWALRSVATPEGPRLLGACTVVLTHNGRVVAQTTARLSRPDVAEATSGEAGCGFVLEIPPELRFEPIFRVYVMPERQELAGSPCVRAETSEVTAQL